MNALKVRAGALSSKSDSFPGKLKVDHSAVCSVGGACEKVLKVSVKFQASDGVAARRFITANERKHAFCLAKNFIGFCLNQKPVLIFFSY